MASVSVVSEGVEVSKSIGEETVNPRPPVASVAVTISVVTVTEVGNSTDDLRVTMVLVPRMLPEVLLMAGLEDKDTDGKLELEVLGTNDVSVTVSVLMRVLFRVRDVALELAMAVMVSVKEMSVVGVMMGVEMMPPSPEPVDVGRAEVPEILDVKNDAALLVTVEVAFAGVPMLVLFCDVWKGGVADGAPLLPGPEMVPDVTEMTVESLGVPEEGTTTLLLAVASVELAVLTRWLLGTSEVKAVTLAATVVIELTLGRVVKSLVAVELRNETGEPELGEPLVVLLAVEMIVVVVTVLAVPVIAKVLLDDIGNGAEADPVTFESVTAVFVATVSAASDVEDVLLPETGTAVEPEPEVMLPVDAVAEIVDIVMTVTVLWIPVFEATLGGNVPVGMSVVVLPGLGVARVEDPETVSATVVEPQTVVAL